MKKSATHVNLLVLFLLFWLTPFKAIMQASSQEGYLFLGATSFTSLPAVYTMNLDGTNIQPLTANGLPVSAQYAVPSPDGRYIGLLIPVQVTRNGFIETAEIAIYNRSTQAITSLVQYPGNASKFSWTPDSTGIIYAAGDATWTDLVVVNIDGSGQRTLTNTAAQRIQVLDPVYSPDGTRIAYIQDGGLMVMNADGTSAQALVATTESVSSPRWSADGAYLSYGSSGTLRVIPSTGGEPVATADIGAPDFWLQDRNTVVSFGLIDRTVLRFTDNLGVFTMDIPGGTPSLLFKFDLGSLAIALWLSYLPPLNAAPVEAGSVTDVIGPAAQPTSAFRVITAANAAQLQEAGSTTHNGYYGRRPLSFQAGTPVLAFADGFSVRIWDLASNQEINAIPLNENPTAVAFNPLNGQLAVATRSGSVMLLDIQTGQKLGVTQFRDQRPYADADEPIALAYRPDGAILAVAAYGAINFVDSTSLLPITVLSLPTGLITEGINDVRFSGDGTRIAYAESTGYAAVGEVSTNNLLAIYSRVAGNQDGRLSEQNSVALSPSGQLAATGHSPGVSTYIEQGYPIDLWTVPGGALQLTLPGHDRTVQAVTFNHDGTLLASGAGDNTVRVWDTTTGAMLAVLPVPYVNVSGLTFSSDGTILAAYSDNSLLGPIGAEGMVQWWVVPG